MAKAMKRYENTEEVESLVSRFESCALPPEEFRHGAHVAVALWYLSRMSLIEATEQMRDGLHRYLAFLGESGYNETITLFWLKLARHFLDRTHNDQALTETINEFLETFGDSKLIFKHYSQERVSSEEARARWVEPDLRPLGF